MDFSSQNIRIIAKLSVLFGLITSTVFAQFPDGQDVIKPILSNTTVYPVMATGSMKPTFDENNYLCVKNIPFEEVREGDIILYKLNKPITLGNIVIEIICHRVWRRSSGGSILLAKGDANSWVDETFITKEMYLGVVVGIIRIPR